MLEFNQHKYYQPVYDKDKVSFFISPTEATHFYVNGKFVVGPAEAIDFINKDLGKLNRVEKRLEKQKQMSKKLKELAEQQLPINNQSFELLVKACEFLIEEAKFQAVIEPKIESYVEWYEKHRADDTAPKSDFRTYRMCKMVIEMKKHLQILNKNSSDLVSI